MPFMGVCRLLQIVLGYLKISTSIQRLSEPLTTVDIYHFGVDARCCHFLNSPPCKILYPVIVLEIDTILLLISASLIVITVAMIVVGLHVR